MSPRLREQLAANADRFGPYAWKHNAQLDGERLAAEFGLSRRRLLRALLVPRADQW